MKRNIKERGVLLIATGHKNYYRMAAVLAASIRCTGGLSVCLVTDADIPEREKHLFDIVKKPVRKYMTQKYPDGERVEFIKNKVHMYDYSPFEETIFLDVDQVVIHGRSLAKIFDEMEGIDFSMSNTGEANGMSIWCDIDEVQEIYGKKPFWNFHSELVYFRKSIEASLFFAAAIEVYNDNKVPSATKFAGAAMADELAFQCAAIITGIYPHKQHWTPNYWHDRHTQRQNMMYTYELTDYTTYSIGGNRIPARVKKNYNTLAKAYFAKLGLLNPYEVVDKQHFLPERNHY